MIQKKPGNMYPSNLPIGAIVILVIALLFTAIWVWPATTTWLSQKDEIKTLETKVETLKNEVTVDQKTLDDTNAEFEKMAAPQLAEEARVFPETIDPKKVSKILELYGLQTVLLESNPYFKLKSLSFGDSTKPENGQYAKTSLNLNFTADQKTVVAFTKFLQTGELAPEFSQAKENGFITATAYNFLKENTLPLININSLNFTSEKATDSERTDLMGVQMTVSMFSQK